MDFNINHYLVEEKEIVKDPHRFDCFYGTLEEKPESEQLLFKLQAEYLKTRDQKIWSEMFHICWSYIQSLIKKRQRGKNFIEPDDLNDKTTNATLTFMSQYLTNPEFEVGASFAGMMTWKIVEVMYETSKDDRAISLDMAINDDNKHTLNDIVSDEENHYQSPEESLINDSMSEIIDEILSELDDVIKNDWYRQILVRAYILLCVKHPKNRHAKRIFMNKWCTDVKTEKLVEYVMLEIYNRLSTGEFD